MGIERLSAFAFERLPVTASITSLTSGTYAPSGIPSATAARIVIADAPLRYRTDGQNVSPFSGMLGPAGAALDLYNDEVVQFRAIRTTDADAVLSVTYYR